MLGEEELEILSHSEAPLSVLSFQQPNKIAREGIAKQLVKLKHLKYCSIYDTISRQLIDYERFSIRSLESVGWSSQHKQPILNFSRPLEAGVIQSIYHWMKVF